MNTTQKHNQSLSTNTNSLTPKLGIAMFVIIGLTAAFWLWASMLSSI